MIKVGLIGYGYLGKFHAQKAEQIKECSLVAIVEPNESLHGRIIDLYPKLEVLKEVDDLYDKVDAALVVTPTSFHFDVVKKLLQKNIHIFCEKPLFASSAEVNQINDFINESSSLIQVGHSERYHRIWTQFEQDLAQIQGEKPLQWYAIRAGIFKNRANDVSVIDDLMIHDLDLINMFNQSELKHIDTKTRSVHTENTDHAVVSLVYENSDSATLISSRAFVEERREFWVTGSAGTLYVDLIKKIYRKSLRGSEQNDLMIEKNYEPADHLLLEQQDFYQSILNETSPQVSWEQGCKIVNWLDRIKKS